MSHAADSTNAPDPSSIDGVADSRRSEMRFSFAALDAITLWMPRDATLADESFSGIGLLVDDPAGIALGQQVAIDYQGERAAAHVRNVRLAEQGQWRVGLEWDEPGGPFGAEEADG